MKNVSIKPNSTKKWTKLVSDELATEAVRIATFIADRMLEGDLLADNIAELPNQALTPDMQAYWDGFGLMQGFAGLAVMYNQLDRCFADEGWRRVGSHFLKIASEVYEQSKERDNGSLCEGSPGLGFAALQSPRGKASYSKLLKQVNSAVEEDIKNRLASIDAIAEGLQPSQFDALYGITGSGRFLLACGSSKQPASNLDELLETLVSRSKMKDGVPRLHTPHELLHPLERAEYTTSIVNCGLAHGIPGPLALMALALNAGYEMEGLDAAIEFWSQWLKKQIIQDEWGINWPGTVPVNQDVEPQVARAGWCYGSPGVARSLYLAGSALGDSDLKNLATDAMLSVYKRPMHVQQNATPSLCHGRSGLLQITTRFATDTGLPEFQKATEDLCKELVDSFDENKIWGYQDLGPDGSKIDNPGLLNGAAGIVLALLSAAGNAEPIWDQTFLIS